MTRTLGTMLVLIFGLSLAGCVVRPARHGHRHQGSTASRPSCHPSQYWDGHQCRHKGKGHGARKHDGR